MNRLRHEIQPELTPYDIFARRVNQLPGTYLASAVRFDGHVERLQHEVAEKGIDEATQERIDWISRTMQSSVAIVNQPTSIDWADVFRFTNHMESVEQRVKAPFAFAERGDATLRRKLVEGQYGVNAQIIESAISLYDGSDDEIQQGYLRGVINEQTTIALINRAQSPDHLAFSSSATDDHVYKSDVDYWRHSVNEGGQKTNIQVKSSRLSGPVDGYEDGLTYVYAADFSNTDTPYASMPTSRYIVKEASGTINAVEMTLLEYAHMNLMRRLHSATAQSRYSLPTGTANRN